MKKITLMLFIVFSTYSCNNKYEYDAEGVAKEYCNCMKNNNAPTEYWYAKKVCDGKLTEKNYFFRLIEVEVKVKEYGKISNSLLDSVILFHNVFDKYLKENCCKTVDNCDNGKDRPANQRLGL